MEILNKQKGITLIALTITIIVLLIIVSISVEVGQSSIKKSKESALVSELNMVHHAVLEIYTRSQLMKDESILPSAGTYENEIDNLVQTINTMSNDISEITLKDTTKTNYHLLQEEQLKELGIENTDDEYVVNYVTGEVFNITQKVTESGKSLYIYSKENT